MSKHKLNFIIIFITSLLLLFSNCSAQHDSVEEIKDISSVQEEFLPSAGDASKPTFLYVKDKIFDKKCTSCHNTQASQDVNNPISTDFTSYQSVIENAVSPQDPDNSLLFVYLYTELMPLNDNPLSDEELILIKTWIEQGAIEYVDGESPPPKEENDFNGEVLYAKYCATCHRSITNSEKEEKRLNKFKRP